MREINIGALVKSIDENYGKVGDAYIFSGNRKFNNIDSSGSLYNGDYIPANALMIGGEYVLINGEYVLLTE